MKNTLLLVLFLPLLFSFTMPEYKAPVTDEAGIISPEVEAKLNSVLMALSKATTAQIALVTLASLENQNPGDVAVKFGEKNGVGSKKEDNGVVILIAPNDRKIFIATGYGVEDVLPDGKLGRIQDELIVPSFRAGKMEEGIVTGTIAIAQIVAQKYNVKLEDLSSLPIRQHRKGKKIPLPFLLIGVVLFIFLGGGRRNLYHGGGGFGGGFGGGGGSFGGGGFGGGFGGGGGSFGGGGAGRSW